MTLDITDQERVFLPEPLEAKNTAMLHGLRHSDAPESRGHVRRRIDLLEGLKPKVGALPPRRPGHLTFAGLTPLSFRAQPLSPCYGVIPHHSAFHAR